MKTMKWDESPFICKLFQLKQLTILQKYIYFFNLDIILLFNI